MVDKRKLNNMLNNLQYNSSEIPSKTTIFKADSGASQHYIRNEDKSMLKNLQFLSNGPKVTLPNCDIIQANETGQLPLPDILSDKSKNSHVFKHITNASLLSIR